MRTTSAIGRSASELDRPIAVNRLAVRGSPGGFTLVEVMVVLVIIALITGSALLSFGLVGRASGAAGDVERLQSRLLAARVRFSAAHRRRFFFGYCARHRAVNGEKSARRKHRILRGNLN